MSRPYTQTLVGSIHESTALWGIGAFGGFSVKTNARYRCQRLQYILYCSHYSGK